MKKQSNEQINFYPIESSPTAPPEIIIDADVDSNFRINQIINYKNYLITEINKRELNIKNFKMYEWVCFVLEIIVVFIDLLFGVTGVFYENTSMTSVCLIMTALSSFIRGLTRKIMRVIEKEKSIYILAQGKLNIVKEKYDIAIKDGNINHNEYLNIISEFQKYEEYRNELNLKQY